MAAETLVAIIGGTGLGEALGALGPGEVRELDTPFGRPSGPITLTEVDGVRVALLSRHGEGHLLNPTQVPYSANLFALKALGVTHVLASGAVGSLREEIAPRDLVVPDQLIDRTTRRAGTFFEELSVHVELSQPFCPALRRALLEAGAAGGGARVHAQGTYVCMEGPALSTRAESLMHRAWGADLVGMTAMPEAKLAREAELHYALVALPTDYDCWQLPPPGASAQSIVEGVVKNLRAVTASGLALIRRALPRVAALPAGCGCDSALALGIWSDRARTPPEVRRRLAPLLGKYLPAT
ncbi:S-methyl-5'-thioadenosine phosphorylase [Aggregicoccus sp. 17bor-14]|uniref:S-methyl-5'-thioadenosine phosphorylase n=1 Tax=Myxococcaceae TaxID=31 RepID=UPI00129C9188|nr:MULTISPECIES: S-methyl-5'-thioadenosine phosphorylase [Myxococcaceae]MBF5044576.1 S-methyl-5'-thioadenosine phosphorylase [Simulacricoccus sp. 17bor-14]MRI90321.1 S-methyl-5'-thioadenosine phosphorylase [Aggregicoccus sp. 17bor-14]